MMKKLPARIHCPPRQYDDDITVQLKHYVRRGVAYTLVGTRSFEVMWLKKSLYPATCHLAIHRVIEILVGYKLGLPLDVAVSYPYSQEVSYYRPELTGGIYRRLTDIRSLETLSGVLYQMVTKQKFAGSFSALEIFSVIPKLADAIVNVIQSWGTCRHVPVYPTAIPLSGMVPFPALYLSNDVVWFISKRRSGLKRSDLFYPAVMHFLARQQCTPVQHGHIGIINPYSGKYAVLEMSHYSPKAYQETQALIERLSQPPGCDEIKEEE